MVSVLLFLHLGSLPSPLPPKVRKGEGMQCVLLSPIGGGCPAAPCFLGTRLPALTATVQGLRLTVSPLLELCPRRGRHSEPGAALTAGEQRCLRTLGEQLGTQLEDRAGGPPWTMGTRFLLSPAAGSG